MDHHTLRALEIFPDQLQSLYAAFAADSKHWAPPSWDGVPSEPLTAIEQICHVLDVEVEGYHVRFRRTLEESTPTLPALDTDALAHERGYGERAAEEVFQQFRVARIETLRVIRSLDPQQLERPAWFDSYGAVTVRSLVHYLCSHDQQHLAGLQWLLGKLSSRNVTSAAQSQPTTDMG